MSAAALEVAALFLVGCLWGCTNPFLRRASTDEGYPEVAETNKAEPSEGGAASLTRTIVSSLSKFRHARVYLPYLLNQSGSLVFYVLLSRSSLSLAVPVCNALALVASVATSRCLGERVNKPRQAVVGAALVVAGVAICLSANGGDADEATYR